MPNLLSLGAVDLSEPTTEVTKLSISDVHKKYRYELGSYLANALPNAKGILLADNTEIRVTMDFKGQGRQVSSSQVLESTDRFEDKNRVLKDLGVKGFGRYFDTFFYVHHLKQFRNKVFGGAYKCSDIFR